MQYANRGATLSIRLNRRVKRKFLAEKLLDQGKCGVEEKFNYPASRNRFAKDNPWKNSALRTRGKIQLRKYFNFIPRPLDAARRQELFHALSPSPDLFDALLSNFLHTPPSPYRFLLFRSMARALSTLVVPVVHASMRVDAWKIPPRTRRYVLVLVPKEREVWRTLELTGLLPSKIPRFGSFQDDRKV